MEKKTITILHSWILSRPFAHRVGRQSKTPIQSRNVDQKSLETEFSIAICRHTVDKWQSKTLFLSIFDLSLSIVDSIFDCRLPGVFWNCHCFLSHILNIRNIVGTQKNRLNEMILLSTYNILFPFQNKTIMYNSITTSYLALLNFLLPLSGTAHLHGLFALPNSKDSQ